MKPTLLALALLVSASGYSVVLFSEDFEGLSDGSIHGQNGWQSSGANPVDVASGFAHAGNKAAKAIVRGAPGSNYVIPASHTISFDNANPNLIATVSAWVYKPSSQWLDQLGIGFLTNGGSIYAQASSSGRVFLVNNGPNTFGYSPNSLFLANTWTQLQITVNYAADSIRLAVNGTDTGLNVSLAGKRLQGITTVSNFNLATTSAAYYDDVRVTQVPEPATLAVVGVGAAALLRRRRRLG